MWGECGLFPGGETPGCGFGSQTRNVSCLEFPSWPPRATHTSLCAGIPRPEQVGTVFRLFLWSDQVGTVYVDCWVRTGGHCFRLILRLEQVGTVYGESWLEQVFTVYAAS